jgi:hypothetical protein
MKWSILEKEKQEENRRLKNEVVKEELRGGQVVTMVVKIGS